MGLALSVSMLAVVVIVTSKSVATSGAAVEMGGAERADKEDASPVQPLQFTSADDSVCSSGKTVGIAVVSLKSERSSQAPPPISEGEGQTDVISSLEPGVTYYADGGLETVREYVGRYLVETRYDGWGGVRHRKVFDQAVLQLYELYFPASEFEEDAQPEPDDSENHLYMRTTRLWGERYLHEDFYCDGRLRRRGEIQDGAAIGSWQLWDELGQLTTEQHE